MGPKSDVTDKDPVTPISYKLLSTDEGLAPSNKKEPDDEERSEVQTSAAAKDAKKQKGRPKKAVAESKKKATNSLEDEDAGSVSKDSSKRFEDPSIADSDSAMEHSEADNKGTDTKAVVQLKAKTN